MKFAVVGAGAIGGFAGGCLAAGGAEVALVARGAHLDALRRNGVHIQLRTGASLTAHPFVTGDPRDIGPVDAVLLAMKAPGIRAAAPALSPLLGSETAVIAGQNGLPWWYFEKCGGSLEGMHLESVDPGGFLSSVIPASRVIGCVIYCSARVSRPGEIEQIEGNRFAIGELDGRRSDRCRRIAQAFQQGGLKCAVRARIRHDVWVKLIGNLALNPISLLARASIEEILRLPETERLARAVMEEGEAVARAAGMELEISIDQRIGGAARTGAHRTSMLQDFEAGRPLELEAIAGAVIELADRLGISIPHTRAVYACARLLESGAARRAGSEGR
jgi:2-dehydropantoate 2-reductase